MIFTPKIDNFNARTLHQRTEVLCKINSGLKMGKMTK